MLSPNPTYSDLLSARLISSCPVFTSSGFLCPVTLFLPQDPDALLHSVTVCFTVSSFLISSFFAPKSVTAPCYSFCFSCYKQKLQISEDTVRGTSASSLSFSLYYCTNSPLLQHPALQPLSESFSLPSPTLGVLVTLPTMCQPPYSSVPSFW